MTRPPHGSLHYHAAPFCLFSSFCAPGRVVAELFWDHLWAHHKTPGALTLSIQYPGRTEALCPAPSSSSQLPFLSPACWSRSFAIPQGQPRWRAPLVPQQLVHAPTSLKILETYLKEKDKMPLHRPEGALTGAGSAEQGALG